MKIKKRYILIPILSYLFVHLLFISYVELKNLTIEKFNIEQMELAEQSAVGIETLFKTLKSDVVFLANLDNVKKQNKADNLILEQYYQAHSKILKAITRVNREGTIICTYPKNKKALGADISNQKHMKTILKTHKPVLSDVFTTVQGFQSIALHVPVFNKGKFKGTLGLVIDFTLLAKNFIAPINAKNKSFAVLLSSNGTELYCSNTKHIGENMKENGKNIPSLLLLYDKIMKEKKGFGSFTLTEKIHDIYISEKEHTIFTPVNLQHSFWIIFISTPEKTILSPAYSLRDKLLYLSVLLLSIVIIFVYLSVKASTTLREADKRKVLAKKLEESEQNFREVLEKTPIGIAITNQSNNPIFVNNKFVEMFGYRLSEIENILYWEENVYPDPEYRKFINQQWLRGLVYSKKSQKAVGMKEIKIKCKNSDYKIVDTTVYAVSDKSITVFIDQTERVKTNKAKKNLEEKLHRSKKMEALGLLASGVAHDLNNILSGLVTLPEIILLKMGKRDPNRSRVETIYHSGIKASAVVNDLLTIARGIATKKTVFNIDSIVKDYFDSPEFKNLEKKYPLVKVISKLNAKNTNILGSEIHIRKSIMNLITNAFEVLENKGFISISINNIQLNSTVKCYQIIPTGNYVVLEISDSGKGIDKNYLNRIFEPFFTRKQMGMSGTGLGLAIVWNTMEDHGGYIDLTSEIGKGTSFKLYFPLSKEKISETGDYISINSFKGKGEKILVVDDEEIQRSVASELLVELNYTPTVVSSGEEAVKKIKTTNFDLILLDMILQDGINGKETYKRIKEISPNQKAIIVTGMSSSKDVDETIALGASSIITKPYAIAEIALALKDVLQK